MAWEGKVHFSRLLLPLPTNVSVSLLGPCEHVIEAAAAVLLAPGAPPLECLALLLGQGPASAAPDPSTGIEDGTPIITKLRRHGQRLDTRQTARLRLRGLRTIIYLQSKVEALFTYRVSAVNNEIAAK